MLQVSYRAAVYIGLKWNTFILRQYRTCLPDKSFLRVAYVNFKCRIFQSLEMFARSYMSFVLAEKVIWFNR